MKKSSLYCWLAQSGHPRSHHIACQSYDLAAAAPKTCSAVLGGGGWGWWGVTKQHRLWRASCMHVSTSLVRTEVDVCSVGMTYVVGCILGACQRFNMILLLSDSHISATSPPQQR